MKKLIKGTNIAIEIDSAKEVKIVRINKKLSCFFLPISK
jgi:hypothetical protein